MFMYIIAALICAAAFGFPVLPVLVGGAVLMAVLAYMLTRIATILKIAVGLIIVLGHRLVLSMAMPPVEHPWMSFLASDEVLGAVAVVVILASWGIGMFGPLSGVPLDMEGVVRKVQDVDAATKTSILLKRLMHRK